VLSPEKWARVLPVKKIKSSTAITGLLKSMTEAARLNLAPDNCPAPQKGLT